MAETTRIDKWLWATRQHKTRSAAATACTGGKVKLNGESAKPASKVKVGDTLNIRRRFHTETISVVTIIEKRVSAVKAATCFEDQTSDDEILAARQAAHALRPNSGDPVYAQREPGSGRPTKRDRRKLDRLRRP